MSIGLGDIGLGYQCLKLAVTCDPSHAEVRRGAGYCAAVAIVLLLRCGIAAMLLPRPANPRRRSSPPSLSRSPYLVRVRCVVVVTML